MYIMFSLQGSLVVQDNLRTLLYNCLLIMLAAITIPALVNKSKETSQGRRETSAPKNNDTCAQGLSDGNVCNMNTTLTVLHAQGNLAGPQGDLYAQTQIYDVHHTSMREPTAN